MKRLVVLIVMLALLLPGASARMQEDMAPLLILLEGDIWSWDGAELDQLTTWGYNGRPVVSPDGQYVAYTSWAEVTVEGIALGAPAMGALPSNIWVGDLATGDFFRAADQPEDAVFAPETEPAGIVRSAPAWSPDGTLLAWSEVVVPGYTYRLATYDLASGAYNLFTDTLPTAAGDAGSVPTLPVWWSEEGIATEVFYYADSGPVHEVYIYNDDGSRRAVGGLEVEESVVGWVYYDRDRIDYVGLINRETEQIGLVDPDIGTVEYVNGLLHHYIPDHPDFGAVVGIPTPNWYVWDKGLYPIGLMQDIAGGHVALAPDAVAYANEWVYIWRDGELERVPDTEGAGAVAWYAAAWQVLSGMGGGSSFATNCAGAPTSRLSPGQQGQATSSQRLYAGPSASSSAVGTLPTGSPFDVLQGPVCSEGYAWWNVSYQGAAGWAAEGEGSTYWLEPVP